MKDKEKQIEEMAKDICSKTPQECVSMGGRCNCLINERALEKLYNANYRKLPKDSVVFSREEYQKDFSSQFNKGYKHGSKETAEKCISILEKNYKDWLKVLNDLKIDTSNKNILVSIVCGLFKNPQEEIAKQFGIEIKE